ncbi:hypothetical protein MB02_14970 [Croceicoccus estronivorus]|uniref:YeiH family protein n=1 Tax=Croceicoccus estronivorus TaxID=1172626 RepID=UPI00082B8CED|nr:putative sulfate exporter family transporter [Croceicoccus estronivorus]OCC22719.1 hypothetical protein MB02_14970 [Croceicoccus estronivorus]
MTLSLSLRAHVPGLMLCAATALTALLLEHLERLLLGRTAFEALVLAIVLGAIIRTIWTPPRIYDAGIKCAAKTMLEIAVALMGATVSFGTMAAAGLPLLLSIIATVIGAILASYLVGRVIGLPGKMAMLIACGNAICGNSAIAAVAPVIDADSDDVATAIAFTAVLGIGVIIALPIATTHLHLSPAAGGMLAGLTVYAVPQVLAAAGPMGSTAVQAGTLVKLVRVLMLGPVVAGLSLFMARRTARTGPASKGGTLLNLLPPFILAFLGLAGLRSIGVLPHTVAISAHHASEILTVLAMAGLGLGVDLRDITAAGPRVVVAVAVSLLLLAVTALLMLKISGLA